MAMDRGIDTLDTAAYYGDGESERILRQALKAVGSILVGV